MRKLIFFCCFTICSNTFSQKKITVAKDGTGDFETIQSALDAVPSANKLPVTIYIKSGIYKETIIVDARKSFITLSGDKKNKPLISFDNHAGTRLPNADTLNTWTCATVFIYANDFRA